MLRTIRDVLAIGLLEFQPFHPAYHSLTKTLTNSIPHKNPKRKPSVTLCYGRLYSVGATRFELATF